MVELVSSNKKRLIISNLKLDLQLFAGEKTEPATEKRREEARQRGHVAKSHDLEAVVVLLVGFLILKFWGSNMVALVMHYIHYTLNYTILSDFEFKKVLLIVNEMFYVYAKVVVIFLLGIGITAVLGNIVQVGFLWTLEPLIPNLDRLNPVAGLQNLLSWKSLAEVVKSVIKILIVGYIPYVTFKDQMPLFIRFIQLEPHKGFILAGKVIFTMSFKILLIMLVLAIGDYWFQWWRYEEELKMSKEEIKEEYKQREGDPKIKAKIRERQRKLAMSRMMSQVPKATVVITNPIHIAVALRYVHGETPAPKVLAIGTDLLAEKIKEIARAHNIPIIENKPLAQALYRMVDVGDEIPRELYEAVAEILAQVYRMKQSATT